MWNGLYRLELAGLEALVEKMAQELRGYFFLLESNGQNGQLKKQS